MRRTSSMLTAIVLGTLSLPLHGQAPLIAGRVVDAVTGRPLSSGVVRLSGDTLTDRLRPDGVFFLRAPGATATLRVSSDGYQSREVAVLTGLPIVVIQLFPEDASPTVVDGSGIAEVPASTVEEALQGKLLGVDVTTNSGAPGDIQVRLRGVTSILGNSRPLWVLDGVILGDLGGDPGLASVTGAPTSLPSRIADLAPQDIETIEVLRGAAATTLYGSRGGNGVIVIRTRRGGRGH